MTSAVHHLAWRMRALSSSPVSSLYSSCPSSSSLFSREAPSFCSSSSFSGSSPSISQKHELPTRRTNLSIGANAVQSSHHNSSSSRSSSSSTIYRRQFVSGSTVLLALSAAAASSVDQASAVSSAEQSSDPTASSSSSSSNNLLNNNEGTKSVFVAGATGNTGKRIVRELLSRGFKVRAGVRDLYKAKEILPSDDKLEFVLADVTQGVEKLAQAISGVDAVVVATGFRPSFTDPFASWNVDNLGTVALVDASRKAGVKRFVLVSSLLVNGAAIGQFLNPAYIVLNLLGLTLVAKLQAEKYVRKSGIDYTIIRPGGLKNDPASGNIVLAPEDTLFTGSVSRDSVAQVAVDSLLFPEASFKVVEIVARPDAPAKSVQELLASIPE